MVLVQVLQQLRPIFCGCDNLHVWVELDWVEGEFFDPSKLYLVCATHGAAYLPESGRCIAGPCSGRGLTPLRVTEADGNVFLSDLDNLQHG